MTKIPPRRCDEIDRLVYGVHMDYCITSFPIDEKRLAAEMGFALIPYSDLPERKRKEIESIIQTGFHICSKEKGYPVYTIVYNDKTEPGRAKLTVFHEIGHILLNHGSNPSPKEESEADYFAKQLAAPRCLLRLRGHAGVSEIHDLYGLSIEAAEYSSDAVDMALFNYGKLVFENDREYIKWAKQKGVIPDS